MNDNWILFIEWWNSMFVLHFKLFRHYVQFISWLPIAISFLHCSWNMHIYCVFSAHSPFSSINLLFKWSRWPAIKMINIICYENDTNDNNHVKACNQNPQTFSSIQPEAGSVFLPVAGSQQLGLSTWSLPWSLLHHLQIPRLRQVAYYSVSHQQ